MSAQWLVQEAVFALLNGAASVPVLDDVPDNQQGDYVTIGDATDNEFDAAQQTGFDMTVIVHTWSVYRGKKALKNLMGEVYDILNRADLVVLGYDVLDITQEFSEARNDPDGVTRHGVQRFRVLITKQ